MKEIRSQSIKFDSSDDEARKSKESSPIASQPLEVLTATFVLDSAPVSDESHVSPLCIAMAAFSIKHSSFEDSVTITPALLISSAALHKRHKEISAILKMYLIHILCLFLLSLFGLQHCLM